MALSTLVRGPVPLLKELAGLQIKIVAGGAAGNLTLTGISTADVLKSVIQFDASVPSLIDRTAEFSITAADTINNTGGTNTTGDFLQVIYFDVSAYTGV